MNIFKEEPAWQDRDQKAIFNGLSYECSRDKGLKFSPSMTLNKIADLWTDTT